MPLVTTTGLRLLHNRVRTASLMRLVVLICGLILPVTAQVAPPAPPWQEDNAAVRLVLPPSAADTFALCALPTTAADQPISAFKALTSNKTLPLRLIHVDATNAHVLVDCRGLGNSEAVAVYGIVGSGALQPDPANLVDPNPIRIVARNSVGQDSPATLAELKMLTVRPGAKSDFFAATSFDNVPAVIGRYAKGGGWSHPLVLLRLATWLYVPQTTAYAFALKGDNAAWLQIDGAEVVAQSYSRGRPGQRESRTMTLKAGLHRLVVDTAVRYAYDLTVLWHTPDKNALEPQLISGAPYVHGRLEQRAATLHPFIRTQRGAPYRFQGTDAVFSMLALQDGSLNWTKNPLQRKWSLNDTFIGAAEQVQTLLVTTNNSPFVVKLEVATADDSASASSTTSIPPDPIPSTEFRISSALGGVPAICYADDPVTPVIEVRASAPDLLHYTLNVAMVNASGHPTLLAMPLQLTNSWGQLTLPVGRAGGLREIVWQVTHGDMPLCGGRHVLETTPFATLPDGVSGVALLRGNDSLTLIARRASQGEANAFKGLRQGQRLIFLDGFVAPAASANNRAAIALDTALANGPQGLKVAYQRIALHSLDRDDDPRGVSRLMPLANLRQLLPVDVILMAPDLSGARDSEAIGTFERRLAAFVGTLTEAGKAQVILVAPPAFDVLPGCGCAPAADGPCPHAAASRLYAETVYRVADAYGLTVADLYTPFALHKGPGALVRAGVLTPDGLNKATEIFHQLLYR